MESLQEKQKKVADQLAAVAEKIKKRIVERFGPLSTVDSIWLSDELAKLVALETVRSTS